MDYVHMETDYVARSRRAVGRSVARHGARRVPRDPGVGEGALGLGRSSSAQDRRDSGLRARRLLSREGAARSGREAHRHRHRRGAREAASSNEFGARAVGADEIYGVQADIFAPCALGAIINDKTIPQLKVEIVAGAANNVLLEERHGDALEAARHSLRAGLRRERRRRDQRVLASSPGWTLGARFRKADEIYDTILRVFEIAKSEGIPTYVAADRLAEQRIKAVGSLVKTWPQWPNR